MINWPVEQPTLVHGDITLRPLKEKDIDPIFQACQDPTITAFTRVPYPYERSMAEEFVRESDTAYRNHHSISFAIEVEGKFVGTIGLHSLSIGDHTSEVGYWMDPDFRAKGICTQALKALSDFAIQVMGFRRLEAYANFDNVASQRVMERAGYQRDALLKNAATNRLGEQFDMALYSMISN
jgi:RimJ/RimL family protein N-acetyltransferase